MNKVSTCRGVGVIIQLRHKMIKRLKNDQSDDTNYLMNFYKKSFWATDPDSTHG